MSASERAGAQPAPPPVLPPHWVVVTALSLLLGRQPVATDLYLPALPQMPASLGVSAAAVQWTLSVLVLAFGIAQLFWGPVSDRVGRRPVLLVGLTLFTLASVGTVAAPDLNVLVLARALQGVGLAASLVCARAMVRDLYEPHEGAPVMSKALSGLGVIALVGPIIGGITAASLGWRATLALLGLFALARRLTRLQAAMSQPLRYYDLVLMLFAIGALQGRWQSGADGLLIRRAPVRYPTAPLDPTCRPLPTSA